MQNIQKTAVVGGGFAGIQLVRQLDEKLFVVLLINKINHRQFQPLFYRVATSLLEPLSISFALRNVCKAKKNLQIRLTEVLFINETSNTSTTTISNIVYDYFVTSTGCKTNFFGIQEMKKRAYTLKITYKAITMRNHILQTFEYIILAADQIKKRLVNLVIVVAKPTGIALAGAFAEVRKNIFPKDYPKIDFSEFKVILVDRSKNTLNSTCVNAKITSRKYLEAMGMIILTDTIVDH
jgi:NADH dehydrogenase